VSREAALSGVDLYGAMVKGAQFRGRSAQCHAAR
jgi:uncharacterized protein YjbI with pentapeptide repeats